MSKISWTEAELAHGKTVHLKKFSKGHYAKLFRLAISTDRTDYVATNEVDQDSADLAREVYVVRWKIEQFHRETSK